MLFEDNLFAAPTDSDGNVDYTTYDVDDLFLFDPDANPVVEADRESTAPYGFYRKLDDVAGEKLIQPSVTLNNVALLASYLPNGTPSEEITLGCTTDLLGTGRVYAIDLATGASALAEETLQLQFSGIPVEPTIIFVENDSGVVKPVVAFGTEVFGEGDEISESLGELGRAYRTFWKEN